MPQKRIATLDFIRGLCIIAMVGLHVFGRVYDASWIGTEKMSDRSLLHITLLLSIAYIGGMAGLFLMVSSTSHTLSISSRLKKGHDLNKVIRGQILTGLLLLIFAFIVESLIGHHGFLGRMAYFDPSSGTSLMEMARSNAPRILYRGFHFMTLHTIAWCIIINSIIQWFLYRNGGIEKIRRNIKIYVLLTGLVILLTPLMWHFAGSIVPGYPFALYPGTDRMVQYPLEGFTSFFQLPVLFILGPIAGQTEPLFPFLFISFIGSMIGIFLSMDRPPKYLPHNGMKIGGVMFLAGAMGIAFMWLSGIDSVQNLIDNTYLILKLNIWFPLLLLTTGGQLVFLMMVLRLVEYRGKAKEFAKKTVVLRRFAAISLTIYTLQYVDALPLNLISMIPGVNVLSGKEGTFWSVMAVASSIITWHLLSKLWEKADFRGSAEWLFTVVQKRKKGSKKGSKWHIAPNMNLIGREDEIDWLEVVPREPKGLDQFRDSILSLWLSIIGLVIIPLSFLAMKVARNSVESEGENRYNRLSRRISRWGIAWGSFITFTLSQTSGSVVSI